MRSGTPELAGPVGAVNVVRVGPGGRTSGNILDGEGLLSGPRTAGQAIAGRRALIVGAGGVGSAITFAVTNAGVRELAVFDVATDRARQPLARLTAAGSAAHVRPPIAAEFDVVINASPADMQAPSWPMWLSRPGSPRAADDRSRAGLFRPAGHCHVRPLGARDGRVFGLPFGGWSPGAITRGHGSMRVLQLQLGARRRAAWRGI
jgi:hypothetical protein